MSALQPPYISQIVRDLRLPDVPLVRFDFSDSNEVFIGPNYVIRFHGLGPAGRLEHESKVAQRLPAEALHPRVIATGWSGEHDWLVQERVPGQPLSVAWPSLSDPEREQAITEFALALRRVHLTRPDGLVPPCLFGGKPFIPRGELVAATLRYLTEADGDRAVLSEAASLARATGRFIDDPPSALIHGDLNFNNIMWDGRVTGLLDFEWARPEARDVDLLSFVSFCHYAELCVPDEVRAVTRREDYNDAPRWLQRAYPELFAHPNFRERLVFYDLARWSQGVHRSTPESRAGAYDQLVEIVNGASAVNRLA